MNYQSICSVLEKGSPVRISSQASHKSPHLAGQTGKIFQMPQHPTTWFKIQFEDGEIATFRSSALIPLDGLGKPLPGFSVENKQAVASQRKAKSASSGCNSSNSERHGEDDTLSTPAVPARRVLREHSGYQNYAMDSGTAYLGGSTQRPRSLSIGTYGRGMSTGFRQYDKEINNPRLAATTTEAERKIFNDFVEVAFASAYVPDCAQNTHGNGLLAHRALSSDGKCVECGRGKWRASPLGGGICWNQRCATSPLFGRARSVSDPDTTPSLGNSSATTSDYITVAQNAAYLAPTGHTTVEAHTPAQWRPPSTYHDMTHPVSPNGMSTSHLAETEAQTSATHVAYLENRGMPRVVSSSSTSSECSSSGSNSTLNGMQQQLENTHNDTASGASSTASDWDVGGRVAHACDPSVSAKIAFTASLGTARTVFAPEVEGMVIPEREGHGFPDKKRQRGGDLV